MVCECQGHHEGDAAAFHHDIAELNIKSPIDVRAKSIKHFQDHRLQKMQRDTAVCSSL